MADSDLVCAPWNLDRERAEALRDRIAASHAASGASPETLALVREYTNLLTQIHPREIGFLLLSGERQAFQTDLMQGLGLVQSDPAVHAAIGAQLEAFAASVGIASTEPGRQQTHRAGDPVDVFSGQFVHEADDVVLNGAGIEFRFRRVYKSQAGYLGPLGASWDHAYNTWLREAGNDVLRSDGQLRELRFTPHPLQGAAGFDYWVPPDGTHGILVAVGDSFAYRLPNGARHLYARETERPLVHRLARIDDRFGNSIELSYAEGLLREARVNHPDRWLALAYDEAGRLTQIRDFTGRRWQYAYDDLGDLVAFTKPGTSRYPDGLTTRYEYDTAAHTAPLQHNLTRIIDPAGRVAIENEYGSAAETMSFNRVVRQQEGAGESHFDYEAVVNEFEFEYEDAERPAFRVDTVLRNGHAVRAVYNRNGNLLVKEEEISEGPPRRLRWRSRYNADGALVALLSPEGVLTQYHHGRDDYLRLHGISDAEVPNHDQLTASRRQAFGNLLAVIHRGTRWPASALDPEPAVWGGPVPDPLRRYHADDAVTKYTYEPRYQQQVTASDPRFTERADPRDPETADYTRTLTEYEYSGPPGDGSRLLRRIRYPATTLPDGTRAPAATEEYTKYDPRGRLLRRVDRAGVAIESTHYDASEGVREGFVRREVIDPDGLSVQTEYEVDLLGRITAVRKPRSVGAQPGRFVTRYMLNKLDEIVETIESPPFSYSTRRLYDRSGLLEREERTLLDKQGRPKLGGLEVRELRYDFAGRVVQEHLGGRDPSGHLVTRHRYDSSDQRVLTRTPRGTDIRRRYDPRLLERSITRGDCTPEASTVRFEYDGDGRRTTTVSGRGNRTRYRHDCQGRVVEVRDPLGGRTLLDFDRSGNLVLERRFGRRPDGSYELLRRTEFDYDELNQRVRETRNLFIQPLLAADPPTNFRAPPGPGVGVTTEYFRDAKGRVTRVLDAEGAERRTVYDALDRVVTETDAVGNRTETRYDAHGNVVYRELREPVVDAVSGAVLGEEVFPAAFEFDELDRQSSQTDALGNVMRTAYDSRGQVEQTTDALGNVRELGYDVYGRVVSETHHRTATGLGGGPGIAPVSTLREYDENGNVVAYVDGRAVRTEQRFDALDRCVEMRYPDGAATTMQLDRDDNVGALRDANGVTRRHDWDEAGRLRRVDVERDRHPSAGSIGGETFEAYAYDGDDRVLSEQNDVLEIVKGYDSLGRCREEEWTFRAPLAAAPGPAPLKLQRQHDLVGRLTGIEHPDGRRLRFSRDKLGRVDRVEELAKGVAYPGAATPVPRNIALMKHRGLRLSGVEHGNGAEQRFHHDAVGRVIESEILERGGSSALRIQQLHDAAGNVRLRNDIRSTGTQGERLRYDSTSQLTNVDVGPDIAPFAPGPHAPFAAPLPDPLPPRQPVVDALLGPLAQVAGDPGFTYDVAGNRTRRRQAGVADVVYELDDLNQYRRIDGTRQRYDAAGNLAVDTIGRSYTYDSRGLLVGVDDGSGQELATFFHDAVGRRVGERREGAITVLVCDGLDVIEERRQGAPHAHYVYDGHAEGPCHVALNGIDLWLHADPIGSIRVVTDATGAVIGEQTFDPYGEPRGATGVTVRVGYAGRWRDADLGLYDMRARSYSPAIGRFLQRDPKGMAGGANLYQYALNNPARLVDPLGTDPTELEKAALRAAGGASGALLNVYGFIELGVASWMYALDIPMNEYGQMRIRALHEWERDLRAVVDEDRFGAWIAEGVKERWASIQALEAQGRHFDAGMVFGDTAMNAYSVGRAGYSLVRGGVRFGCDVYSYGLLDATKGVGYSALYWATRYREPNTFGGLGGVAESQTATLRGSPYANWKTYAAGRDLAIRTYDGEAMIGAGEANAHPAVMRYQAAIGTKLEPMRYGTAVNRVVDDALARSSNPFLSTEIIRQRAFGTNAKGNLIFPDYRINAGNQTVIDITTLRQAGKALKYPAGDVIETYTGTSRINWGNVRPLPLGGSGQSQEREQASGVSISF